MTSLDISNNNLGELVLPAGWTESWIEFEGKWQYVFTHNGAKQTDDPGSKPEGVIAIANAIPAMGALASLDLSQNSVPESEMNQIRAACQSQGISLKI